MTSPLDPLKQFTRARIALGRAGDGLPTDHSLEFSMAHALARDAIHGPVDWDRIRTTLAPRESIPVTSGVTSKDAYLRRPDLGRMLAKGEEAKLPHGPFDIVLVIGDGLSADAVMRYATDTAHASMAALNDFSWGPIVLAKGARVALSDPIGAAMQAQLIVMLIGERPGLTTADSLGAYLTFAPRIGRKDSERNCISNIHAHGLSPELAAQKIAWLAREALRLKLTGVNLKEAAPDPAAISGDATTRLI